MYLLIFAKYFITITWFIIHSVTSCQLCLIMIYNDGYMVDYTVGDFVPDVIDKDSE